MKKIITSIFVMAMLVISATSVYAKNFGVEYVGKTKEVFITDDNFFDDFSNLLPGDIVTDEAYLKNNSNKKIKMFFKIEGLSKDKFKTEEDYKIVEKIKLKVEVDKGSKIIPIYEGTLTDNTNEWKSLGIYDKNEESKFKFSIEIPKNLTNEFNMAELQSKWVFGVGEENSKEPIDTGDNSNIMSYVLLLSVSALIIILLFVKKDKNDKEENSEIKK